VLARTPTAQGREGGERSLDVVRDQLNHDIDVFSEAQIPVLAKVQSKIVIAKARPVAPSVEERLKHVRLWVCGRDEEDLPEAPQMLMERTPPLSQI
jgi:hypothetical protein